MKKLSVDDALQPLTYDYGSGPVKLSQLRHVSFQKANCRRAVQYYLYTVHNVYLRPFEILLPRAYQKTGLFISNHYTIIPKLYKPGDVIFSYKRTIHRDLRQLINLHTAVFTRENKIYHSTSITGQSTIWNMTTFLNYYEILAIKRVIK